MKKWLFAVLVSSLAGCSYYDKAVDKLHTMDMKKTWSELTTRSPNKKSIASKKEITTQGRAHTKIAMTKDHWNARTILFKYDQSSISTNDQKMIKNMASYLKKHPRGKVKIFGHTDERGSSEYNVALGWRRALAIASKLESMGVMPKQMEVVSYGKEKPKHLGHAEVYWKQNRRVEFKYLG